MVHASNNECMQTWVETGEGAYCIRCFGTPGNGFSTLGDNHALPDHP